MSGRFCTLPAFQNKRFAFFKIYAGGKQFPMQNWLERCLLLGATWCYLANNTEAMSDLFGGGAYLNFSIFI